VAQQSSRLEDRIRTGNSWAAFLELFVRRLTFDRAGGASIIRANLSGTDTCTAAGIIARANTPILALWRSLIAAGLDSDRALEVCR
jgi:hypothetical protein